MPIGTNIKLFDILSFWTNGNEVAVLTYINTSCISVNIGHCCFYSFAFFFFKSL